MIVNDIWFDLSFGEIETGDDGQERRVVRFSIPVRFTSSSPDGFIEVDENLSRLLGEAMARSIEQANEFFFKKS